MSIVSPASVQSLLARGAARLTDRISGTDQYKLSIDFKPAGSDWQPMMSGIYNRITHTNA